MRVRIKRREFRALLADSFMKRAIGLMFRDGLQEGTCMLFVFNEEARQGIWMHNMRFAIDVIWLDSGSKIVSLERNLQPCKSAFNCRTHYPDGDAKYILEMRAGTIAKNGIKIGSKVTIPDLAIT